MSDFPQGADWWKANDDNWYPPPAADDGAPPGRLTPAAVEARGAKKKQDEDKNAKIGCGALIAVVIVVSVLWGLVSGDDDGEDSSTGGAPSGDELKYGAFDVCTQFVEQRLRAPGTASFPNEFEDDGEVVWSSSGGTWTVTSHVDSENAFGGEVRTPFICQVRHVSGDNWQLVDLALL